MTDMTKQTEAISTFRALKLALEALESCGTGHISDGGSQWYDEMLVDTTIDVLREALAEPPAQRKPLTDEFLRKLRHEDQFGLFCDYDEFEQIARAIEAAHGIK